MKRRARRERGLTLVELMVSMVLGLLLVLVATGMLVSAKSSFATQDDDVRLHDSARFALELIARAVRQAAYENWDAEHGPVLAAASLSPNIGGWNASRVSASSPGITERLTSSVINGSDVLAVRYFGSGAADSAEAWTGGDGTILNCAGYSVPAPPTQEHAEERRGWSIFYVARSDAGELELYCKYRGEKAFTATALAQGVESFQVLYGLDLDGDSVPDQFLHAGQVRALDDAISMAGVPPAEQLAQRNRLSNWKRVVAVRVALLVRGSSPSRPDAITGQHDLFGAAYSTAAAAADPGVRILESGLPVAERNRMRRVFSTTIHLRNRSRGTGS